MPYKIHFNAARKARPSYGFLPIYLAQDPETKADENIVLVKSGTKPESFRVTCPQPKHSTKHERFWILATDPILSKKIVTLPNPYTLNRKSL